MSFNMYFLDLEKFEKFMFSLNKPQRRAVHQWLVEVQKWDFDRLLRSERVKSLQGGLFEFRIQRQPDLLVRVFFCFQGEFEWLVLHAYDKLKKPQTRWQTRQINIARKLIP